MRSPSLLQALQLTVGFISAAAAAAAAAKKFDADFSPPKLLKGLSHHVQNCRDVHTAAV